MIPPFVHIVSGKLFPFTAPTQEDINIEDIAHSLSQQCRYHGHCIDFYSVAQHSYYVSETINQYIRQYSVKFTDPEFIGLCNLRGLLHDAAETYVSDLATPVKVTLPIFMKYEEKILNVILIKYGLLSKDNVLNAEISNLVKTVDRAMLVAESEIMLKNATQMEWWKTLRNNVNENVFILAKEKLSKSNHFLYWDHHAAKKVFLDAFRVYTNEYKKEA